MGTRTRLLLLGVVCLAGIALTGTASAQQNATAIDSCTTIDEPGRYVLTEDIRNSSAAVCIDIQASNVTFDGNGNLVAGNLSQVRRNEIAGSPESPTRVGVGVNVEGNGPVANVTVRNVTTTGWVRGVSVVNVSDSESRSVIATGNVDGIVVEGGDSDAVTNSTTPNNNRVGVVVAGSDNATVTGNELPGNTYGILADGTTNATVADNDAGNNAVGLVVAGEAASKLSATVSLPAASGGNTSSANTIADNTFSASETVGIALLGANGTALEANDVSNVSGTGTLTVPTSGLYLNDSSDNVVNTTTARDINGSGVVLRNGSDNNTFAGNNVSENAIDGFDVDRTTRIVLTRNTILNNGDDGVDVRNSTRVLLTDNDIRGNADESVNITRTATTP